MSPKIQSSQDKTHSHDFTPSLFHKLRHGLHAFGVFKMLAAGSYSDKSQQQQQAEREPRSLYSLHNEREWGGRHVVMKI